jgi:hypothetical protein
MFDRLTSIFRSAPSAEAGEKVSLPNSGRFGTERIISQPDNTCSYGNVTYDSSDSAADHSKDKLLTESGDDIVTNDDRPNNRNAAKKNVVITCTGSDVNAGRLFDNINEAKKCCQLFAKVPLFQRSAQKGKFGYLQCFRQGTHTMR